MSLKEATDKMVDERPIPCPDFGPVKASSLLKLGNKVQFLAQMHILLSLAHISGLIYTFQEYTQNHPCTSRVLKIKKFELSVLCLPWLTINLEMQDFLVLRRF